MVKPKFDIEATEKAISILIERIKKAFYKHQPTSSDDSLRHSKATERKKPHDSSRCEACQKGKCHLGLTRKLLIIRPNFFLCIGPAAQTAQKHQKPLNAGLGI